MDRMKEGERKDERKGEERRHEGIATELSSSRPHCLDVGEDATTPSRTSLDWMSNTECRVLWISQRVSLKNSEEKLSSGATNRSISRGFTASAPPAGGVACFGNGRSCIPDYRGAKLFSWETPTFMRSCVMGGWQSVYCLLVAMSSGRCRTH
jgi:hypothetical protein